MYLEHWRLKRKPFENTSDPDYYYPGETHQGALLKLRYSVESQRGAALLCGPCGVGKTLLVQTLHRQLSDAYRPFVHLVFPQMPARDLLAYLAAELGAQQAAAGDSLQTIVRGVEQSLYANTAEGKHAVVVVDEAHLLEDSDNLETLRLLLNFETQSRPALTLLLVGQPSLLTILDRMPQLEERMGVKCLLRDFTLDETVSYIQHRLHAAGAKQEIFQSAALEAIHYLSGGIARRINRLCDLALLVGFAEERDSIADEQINAVNEELVCVAPE